MTPAPSLRALPAALGFAFVFAWAQFSFLTALACLLGALVAHVAVGLVTGQTSIGELRARAEAARSGFSEPSTRSSVAPTPPPAPAAAPIVPAPAPAPRPPRNLQ